MNKTLLLSLSFVAASAHAASPNVFSYKAWKNVKSIIPKKGFSRQARRCAKVAACVALVYSGYKYIGGSDRVRKIIPTGYFKGNNASERIANRTQFIDGVNNGGDVSALYNEFGFDQEKNRRSYENETNGQDFGSSDDDDEYTNDPFSNL